MVSSSLRWERIKHFTFFCIPLVVLASANVWLAIHHRSLFLSGVRVHESGQYTLLQTVLYFSHVLREFPIDVGMALFLLERFASRVDFAHVVAAPVVTPVYGIVTSLLTMGVLDSAARWLSVP